MKKKVHKTFPSNNQHSFSYYFHMPYYIFSFFVASSVGNFHFNIIFIMYFKNYLFDNNFPQNCYRKEKKDTTDKEQQQQQQLHKRIESKSDCYSCNPNILLRRNNV